MRHCIDLYNIFLDSEPINCYREGHMSLLNSLFRFFPQNMSGANPGEAPRYPGASQEVR